MSETVNQVIEDTALEPSEKTFTQAEVDAIVGDRLKRERAKYEGFDDFKAKAAKYDEIEEASKTELQKANERATALQTELDNLKKAEAIRTIRESIAAETGVPASLITAEDEESARKQAEQIIEFARPAGYPDVQDGGEVRSGKSTTRQQFANWFENLS